MHKMTFFLPLPLSLSPSLSLYLYFSLSPPCSLPSSLFLSLSLSVLYVTSCTHYSSPGEHNTFLFKQLITRHSGNCRMPSSESPSGRLLNLNEKISSLSNCIAADRNEDDTLLYSTFEGKPHAVFNIVDDICLF